MEALVTKTKIKEKQRQQIEALGFLANFVLDDSFFFFRCCLYNMHMKEYKAKELNDFIFDSILWGILAFRAHARGN